jgi:hypothetical protein
MTVMEITEKLLPWSWAPWPYQRWQESQWQEQCSGVKSPGHWVPGTVGQVSGVDSLRHCGPGYCKGSITETVIGGLVYWVVRGLIIWPLCPEESNRQAICWSGKAVHLVNEQQCPSDLSH